MGGFSRGDPGIKILEARVRDEGGAGRIRTLPPHAGGLSQSGLGEQRRMEGSDRGEQHLCQIAEKGGALREMAVMHDGGGGSPRLGPESYMPAICSFVPARYSTIESGRAK